jgi:hypothetical protein
MKKSDPMSEDFLSFECIQCTSPEMMWGDLHIVPEGIFYLTSEHQSVLGTALHTQLGVLGLLLMRQAKRKIEKRMIDWRAQHAGRPLDQLVEALPDSWSIAPEEMVELKKGIAGLRIKRTEGKPLVLTIDKNQWKTIQALAQAQGWPVK